MAKVKDLTGQRFGKLTVVEYAGYYVFPNGDRKSQWRCKCDCGNVIVTTGNRLSKGETKTCRRCNNKRDKLYDVWRGMRQRCNNPNHHKYKHYGGRGIRVCDEWNDYKTFKEWSYSHGYNPDAPYGVCSLDRIEVDGNYEPTNCRWADMKLQNNNQQKNKKEI